MQINESALRERTLSESKVSNVLIGRDILELVTIGLYNNPLAVYREYLQNSADAVQSVAGFAEGCVDVIIDPSEMTVRIRDNGPGLSYDDALRDLVPIAYSRKQRGTDRGFRGIGRLSGLAFSESVSFLTRSRADQPVTQVKWNGSRLRRQPTGVSQTAFSIYESIEVSTHSGVGYPDHFFEVKLANVARHAASLILNNDAVRNYLKETCPLPMATCFPFKTEVDRLFDSAQRPLTLRVVIAGDDLPLERNHGPVLHFSNGRVERFVEFERFRIPTVDSNDDAAVGWLAHSSYIGAIPKEGRVRGLRAREGNIQIGDEKLFDHLFPEERFNRWCVGEVHIVDPRIVPNARRDYFEPGPHTRNLENRLSAVVRNIVRRCRKASTGRNRVRKLSNLLYQGEEAYALATSGYFTVKDAEQLIKGTLRKIEQIRKSHRSPSKREVYHGCRLRDLHVKLKGFCSDCVGKLPDNIPDDDVAIYQRVFHALTKKCSSLHIAKEVIEAILDDT